MSRRITRLFAQPSWLCAQDPSLRLKNGYARDDLNGRLT